MRTQSGCLAGEHLVIDGMVGGLHLTTLQSLPSPGNR
jgi:hypothetical protein